MRFATLTVALAVTGTIGMTVGRAAKPGGAERCSIIEYPLTRPARTTAMLMRGLPTTARTTAAGSMASLGLRAPRPDEELHGLPTPADTVVGQFAVVWGIVGPGAELIATNDTVLLLPWSYRGDCQTTLWEGPMPWAPVDSVGFVRGVLQSQDAAVGGVPTLDVRRAYWEPYPYGTLARSRRRRGARTDLSPEQLWELYQLLPSDANDDAEMRAAWDRVEIWVAEDSSLLEVYPLQGILRWMQASVSRGRD